MPKEKCFKEIGRRKMLVLERRLIWYIGLGIFANVLGDVA